MAATAYPPMLDLVRTGALRPQDLVSRTVSFEEAAPLIADGGTATGITVLRLGRNVGVYERNKTTQQEVVHAITAGTPTKVAGIPSEAEVPA